MLNPHGRAFRVLLGAQSMVSSLAVDMSLPALPAIAASFDTSAARAQLTIGFYLLGYAAGQLFYGPLSDRFGRRPILLIGMTAWCVGFRKGCAENETARPMPEGAACAAK